MDSPSFQATSRIAKLRPLARACIALLLLVPCGRSNGQQAGVEEYEICHQPTADNTVRVFACSSIAANTNQPPEIRALAFRNRAAAYANNGNFDKAEADFREADTLHPPSSPSAYCDDGIISLREDAGDFAGLIANCGHAIYLDGKHGPAYLGRGIGYFWRGSYDLAIADFARVISILPEHYSGYFRRGWTHILKGEPNRAMPDCSRAIELSGEKNGVGYFCRALVSLKLERYDEALSDANRAVNISPGPFFLDTRALIHEARGSKDQARQDFALAQSNAFYIARLRNSPALKASREAMDRLGMSY